MYSLEVADASSNNNNDSSELSIIIIRSCSSALLSSTFLFSRTRSIHTRDDRRDAFFLESYSLAHKSAFSHCVLHTFSSPPMNCILSLSPFLPFGIERSSNRRIAREETQKAAYCQRILWKRQRTSSNFCARAKGIDT